MAGQEVIPAQRLRNNADSSVEDDVDRVLRADGSLQRGLPGDHTTFKCKDSEPLCRVKKRLARPDMLPRALTLMVHSKSNRWMYITGGVLASIACAATALLTIYNYKRGWYGSTMGIEHVNDIVMASLFILASATAASLCWKVASGRHRAPNSKYKTFLPVPDRDNGSLKWTYYLTSALPPSDAEVLAAAGDGRRGALASKAAAPYQGALTVEQAKIQVKGALVELVSRFKGREGDAPAAADAARDGELLASIVRNVQDSVLTFSDFADKCRANGVTQALLKNVTDSSFKQEVATKVTGLEDAMKAIAPGIAGTDVPAGTKLSEMIAAARMALVPSVPDLMNAQDQYTAAIKSIASLPNAKGLVEPFLASVDDVRITAALKLGLSAVPLGVRDQSIVHRVRRMRDDEVVTTDALLGVARAMMDGVILPYELGRSDRRDSLTDSVWIPTVIALVIVGAWYVTWTGRGSWARVAGALRMGPTSVPEVGVTGTDRASLALARHLVYETWSGVGAAALTEILKYGVLVFAAVAMCYTLKNTGVRETDRLRKAEGGLSDITTALRRLEEAGGCLAVLDNQKRDAALKAVDEIEAALLTDALSGDVASATGTTPVAEIAVYVSMAGAVVAALMVLVQRMQPLATASHMSDLLERSQVGGGILRDLPLTESAYLDSMLSDGVPSDVRLIATFAALCSLGYFFVVMIKNDHKYKDILLNAAAEDRIHGTVA